MEQNIELQKLHSNSSSNLAKLEITDPEGELITITQMDVNSQGKFGTFVKSGGPHWRMSGDYTVKVQYGAEYRTAETTFEFFK